MSRLSKFVDKKLDLSPTAEPNPTHSPTRTVEDLRKDPNYIRVFDGFGREMFVTKERWRTGSLPGALKANWDHPDNLYNILAMAMRDGFFADILDAADHLFHIDPNPSRGSTVYGIVLMKVGKLDQAEEVLCSYLKTHGDDGVILTNLAKVQAARNEMQTAEKTLWRALIADPNTDNAFAWHLAIHRERDGEAAVVREVLLNQVERVLQVTLKPDLAGQRVREPPPVVPAVEVPPVRCEDLLHELLLLLDVHYFLLLLKLDLLGDEELAVLPDGVHLRVHQKRLRDELQFGGQDLRGFVLQNYLLAEVPHRVVQRHDELHLVQNVQIGEREVVRAVQLQRGCV